MLLFLDISNDSSWLSNLALKLIFDFVTIYRHADVATRVWEDAEKSYELCVQIWAHYDTCI